MGRDETGYKMVIVARKDIKISSGKMAAQVAHAAVSCALFSKKNKPKWFRAWFDEGQKKVVVKANSLQELYALRIEADQLGITTSMITDAGLTEVPPGTVTCLGIGPAPNSHVDAITKDLILL